MEQVLLILLGALLTVLLGFIMKIAEIQFQKNIEVNKITRQELMDLYLMIEKIRQNVTILYPSANLKQMYDYTIDFFMKNKELYNYYQRSQIYFKKSVKYQEYSKKFNDNYGKGIKYYKDGNANSEVFHNDYIKIQSGYLADACDALLQSIILNLRKLTNLKEYNKIEKSKAEQKKAN